MNRKLVTILSVLLIAVLSTSTVGAAGAIKLSGSVHASWPLQLDGTLTGLGGYTQGVVVTLDGFGQIMNVTCTSPGGNTAPGQNPGKISVSGSEDIGAKDITKKGTATVQVLANEPAFTIKVCPNGNWKATYDVDWQEAIVQVFSASSSALLLWQHYACAPELNNPGHYLCTLDSEVSYH